MLYAVPPELARALTPSKADRSLCKHRVKDGLPSCPAGEAAGQGPGRSAAASLAQAPSSSLLTASSDRDGKEMGPLLLSLNKCSRTCNLLVSAWARGPHRNSWRAGSLSATCRYSRTMTPRSITRRPFLGMLRSSPCIPSQVRPRVGTRMYKCSLGSTSFTSTPKTSCMHSEAWLKTTGKWCWYALRILSISALVVGCFLRYLRSRKLTRSAIIESSAPWRRDSAPAE
nr:uncharacterized protein LOC105106552 isoform X2 [Camelus dromedarius]